MATSIPINKMRNTQGVNRGFYYEYYYAYEKLYHSVCTFSLSGCRTILVLLDSKVIKINHLGTMHAHLTFHSNLYNSYQDISLCVLNGGPANRNCLHLCHTAGVAKNAFSKWEFIINVSKLDCSNSHRLRPVLHLFSPPIKACMQENKHTMTIVSCLLAWYRGIVVLDEQRDVVIWVSTVWSTPV